jgi:hypothetical protein
MSKKLKENEVPIDFKVELKPDKQGNAQPVITGVYKIKQGVLTNSNTNTTVFQRTVKEIDDSFKQAFKLNPFKLSDLSDFGQSDNFTPPSQEGLLSDTKRLQARGRISRTVTRPTGGRYKRFATLGYNERTEFINGQLKLLLNNLKINNIYDLAKNYNKDKRIQGVIYPSTHLEAGMWLKRFGLTPKEIVQYCFERMFATKDYRAKHLSRNLDNYIEDITKVNTAQPNWTLVQQWAIHLTKNKEQKEIHWRQRKRKYTLKMFYNSDFYKEWCLTHNIPKFKKYSSFCNFMKQSIIDFRKFCRRNSIPIPSVLRVSLGRTMRQVRASGNL